jgi:hypothetical protein
VDADTVKRADPASRLSAFTLPISSTIPVNIVVLFLQPPALRVHGRKRTGS